MPAVWARAASLPDQEGVHSDAQGVTLDRLHLTVSFHLLGTTTTVVLCIYLYPDIAVGQQDFVFFGMAKCRA
jgi:hypothetical protein